MSTRSSIISIGSIHIYHEWADEGFIYASNCDGEAVKLCSTDDWLEIVKFIKENEKDVNGKDILELIY
jgi:hypothetical protein